MLFRKSDSRLTPPWSNLSENQGASLYAASANGIHHATGIEYTNYLNALRDGHHRSIIAGQRRFEVYLVHLQPHKRQSVEDRLAIDWPLYKPTIMASASTDIRSTRICTLLRIIRVSIVVWLNWQNTFGRQLHTHWCKDKQWAMYLWRHRLNPPIATVPCWGVEYAETGNNLIEASSVSSTGPRQCIRVHRGFFPCHRQLWIPLWWNLFYLIYDRRSVPRYQTANHHSTPFGYRYWYFISPRIDVVAKQHRTLYRALSKTTAQLDFRSTQWWNGIGSGHLSIETSCHRTCRG